MRNLLVILMLVLAPGLASCQDKVDRYITAYADIAISEMNRSGIPASITLAQGMFESNYGESSSAMSYNNHFGIKCKKEWTGPYFYKKDDDRDKHGKLIPSCFRAYATVLESYQDHSNFLIERDRYAELFTFHSTDYRNWALGLERCGYATNKMYAERLIDIIERYSLDQFDHVQQIAVATAPESIPITESVQEMETITSEVVESIESEGVIIATYEEADLFKVVEIPATSAPAVAPAIAPVVIDTIPPTKLVIQETPKKTDRVKEAIILPSNYKRTTSSSKDSVSKMK